ncbi:sushi domain-containing protein 2 [Ditylenchus destructor]|nr:sushi domain-containing protein 2 [Ditylenchus destructor]
MCCNLSVSLKATIIPIIIAVLLVNFDFEVNAIIPQAIGAYYTLRYTAAEREKLCIGWHATDPGTAHLKLPACPPNVELADNDPEFARDSIFASTSFFHEGADFCIRSTNDNSRAKYGRQQCCYKDGQLQIGPPGGGSEDLGASFKDHFALDMSTWFYCCYKQPEEKKHLCDLYYEKRLSNDGSEYKVNQ